jgi:hypothetical protein
MKCRERSIFVLDILGRPTLAFEAEDLALAEAFVHAPRFVSSLGEFFANKRKGDGTRTSLFESGSRPKKRRRSTETSPMSFPTYQVVSSSRTSPI